MPLERGSAANDLPDEGFEGLDHSFFLADLRRLLQRTRHIKNQMLRGPTLNQLQEIIDILTSHESDGHMARVASTHEDVCGAERIWSREVISRHRISSANCAAWITWSHIFIPLNDSSMSTIQISHTYGVDTDLRQCPRVGVMEQTMQTASRRMMIQTSISIRPATIHALTETKCATVVVIEVAEGVPVRPLRTGQGIDEIKEGGIEHNRACLSVCNDRDIIGT